MNNRRKLFVALGATTWIPLVVLAQSKKAPVPIAWFHFGSRKTQFALLAAFMDGFAKFGWQAGRDFLMEERWANESAANFFYCAESGSHRFWNRINQPTARTVRGPADPDCP